MKTNNNSFSLRRVCMLMRWDFGTNWKVYAWRYSGLYLGFLAMMLLFSFLLPTSAGNEKVFVNSVVDICLAFFMIMAFRSAILVMERMTTKEGRTTFLMLPASRLEKFVWRAFFVSVLFPLAGVVAFALADLTNYLLCLLLDEQSNLPPKFYMGDYMRYLMYLFLPTDNVTLSVPSLMPRWIYFIYSFGHLLFATFVLVGCSQHRWTGVRMLAGLLLIIWGTPKLLLHFVPDNVTAIYAPADWVNGIFNLLAILCWFLAYRLFCRSQIV